MSLLNNKTYVCYCIHEFEEAHTTLDELSSLLAAACNDDESTFEESELNGMILNSLLPSDPTRLAPAA